MGALRSSGFCTASRSARFHSWPLAWDMARISRRLSRRLLPGCLESRRLNRGTGTLGYLALQLFRNALVRHWRPNRRHSLCLVRLHPDQFTRSRYVLGARDAALTPAAADSAAPPSRRGPSQGGSAMLAPAPPSAGSRHTLKTYRAPRYPDRPGPGLSANRHRV